MSDENDRPEDHEIQTPEEIVDRVCGDTAREFGFRDPLIRAIAHARFKVQAPLFPTPLDPDGRHVRVVTVEDLPRVIAEALDASDRRREERAMRQAVTRDLEGMRKNFEAQLEVLKRYPESGSLAAETSQLLQAIDAKIVEQVMANADMLRESMRQAHAALEPETPRAPVLLPGAAEIARHGKRR